MDVVTMTARLEADWSGLKRGVEDSQELLTRFQETKWDAPLFDVDKSLADLDRKMARGLAELTRGREVTLNIKAALGFNQADINEQLRKLRGNVNGLDKIGLDRTFKFTAEADVGGAHKALQGVLETVELVKANSKITLVVSGGGSGGGSGTRRPADPDTLRQRNMGAAWASALEAEMKAAGTAVDRFGSLIGTTARRSSAALADINLNGAILSFQQARNAGELWAREIERDAQRAGMAMDRFGAQVPTSGGRGQRGGTGGRKDNQESWLAAIGGSAKVAVGVQMSQAASAVGNDLQAGFKVGIGYNNDLQKNLIATTNLMHGNEAAAKRLQGQLEQFALVTPFQFKDLLPQEQQLLAADRPVKTIISDLRAMGDASSGLNRGQEGVTSLALSFAQASATGKITGETLESMRHVGVPALKYLADAWGVSTAKMADMVSKGIVPAQAGLEAISYGMEHQFGGQMDKASRTAEGAWSNIKDSTSKILGSAFADTFGWLNDLSLRVSTISQNKDFQKWCQEVARWFKDGFGFAVETAKWLGSGLKWVFDGIVDMQKGTFQMMWDILKGYGHGVSSFVDSMSYPLQKLLGTQNLATDSLDKGFDWVEKRAAETKQSLNSTFSNLFPSAPKWDEWSKAPKEEMGPPAPQKKPRFTDSDLLKPADDGSKARRDALKREKDELGDNASAWEKRAGIVEAAATREIDKLKQLKGEVASLFGDVQRQFLALGIINDPLAPMLRSFEKLLDFNGKAQRIALPAMEQADALRQRAAQNRARVESLSGLDGVVSTKRGAMVSAAGGGNSSMVDVARSMMGAHTNEPRIARAMGRLYGDEWCGGFVQAVRQEVTGEKLLGGTVSVQGLRDAAKKAGLAYTGTPNAGDVFTIKGKGASHTGIVSGVQDGRVQIVGGNQGGIKDNFKSYVSATSYPLNDPRILYIRSGVATATAQRATRADELPAQMWNPDGTRRGGAPARSALSVRSAVTTSTATNIEPSALGTLLADFVGTVRQFNAVPKGFGDGVKEGDRNTARFAAQSFLAGENGPALLRELSDALKQRDKNGNSPLVDQLSRAMGRPLKVQGSGPDAAASVVRQMANTLDYRLNTERDADAAEKAQKSLRELNTTYSDQIKLAQESGAALQGAAGDMAWYERATALSAERLRLWRDASSPVVELFKAGDKAGANKAFDQLMKGFTSSYDAKSAKELNEAFQERIKLRDEDARAAREAYAEATKAMRQEGAERQLRLSDAQERLKAYRNPRITIEGADEAIENLKTFRTEYKKLVDLFGDGPLAANVLGPVAAQITAQEKRIRDLTKQGDLAAGTRAARTASQDAIGAIDRQRGLYSRYRIDSPQLTVETGVEQRRQQMWESNDFKPFRNASGKLPDSVQKEFDKRLGYQRQELEAQASLDIFIDRRRSAEDAQLRVQEMQRDNRLSLLTTERERLAVQFQFLDATRKEREGNLYQAPSVEESKARQQQLEQAGYADALNRARSAAEQASGMFQNGIEKGMSGGIAKGLKEMGKSALNSIFESQVSRFSRQMAGLPDDNSPRAGDLLGAIFGRNRQRDSVTDVQGINGRVQIPDWGRERVLNRLGAVQTSTPSIPPFVSQPAAPEKLLNAILGSLGGGGWRGAAAGATSGGGGQGGYTELRPSTVVINVSTAEINPGFMNIYDNGMGRSERGRGGARSVPTGSQVLRALFEDF